MGEVGPEQLLKRLAEGEPAAFAALFDCYGPRLFRTAQTLLGNAADAEDAVQEVFVALVRSRSRLWQVESPPAYLFAALRRSAGRIGERQARAPRTSLEVADEAIAPSGESDSPGANERAQWLRTAVQRLPPEQREVIALKIDGELTFQEIAATLGISPHTAASRYRYALEKLRDAARRESVE